MKSLTELLCPNTSLSPQCPQPKMAGDLVRIGVNAGPVFEIVHVAGDKAWVRPLTNGQEGLVALDRLKAA